MLLRHLFYCTLLVLQLVGSGDTTQDDRQEFHIRSSDGTTLLLTVSEKISPELKEMILQLDGAAAYNKFIEGYGKFLNNPKLLMSADPTTMQNLQKKRQKQFIKSLERAKNHNRKLDKKFKVTVNTFAVLDEWERNQFLGYQNLSTTAPPDPNQVPAGLEACRDRLNQVTCNTIKLNFSCSTDPILAEQCELTCGRCGEWVHPRRMDWNERGYVTKVSDQETCGSCWAFAATGVLEWIHKKTTGMLMMLSQQEILDCALERVLNRFDNNGCRGAHAKVAWAYVNREQRLATSRKYKYQGSDSACHSKRNLDRMFPNAIDEKFRLGDFVELPPNLDHLVIEAINVMPLSVAIFADTAEDGSFMLFNDGIYDSCPTRAPLNHAVMLVGYGPDYWTIKNSWGPDWGVNGFGNLKRGEGINMCGILMQPMYVEYEDLDNSDGMPDFPREAKGADERTPDCHDNPKHAGAGSCPYWAKELNYCAEGPYIGFMKDHCKMSCDMCGVRCDPGYFKAPGDRCEQCPINSYNKDPVATYCRPCPAGSWADEGSSEPGQCSECQPGTYLSKDTNRCEECGPDTFSSYGAVECTTCPTNTRSKAGSGDEDDCILPPEECEDGLSKEECQEIKESERCNDPDYLTIAKWGCKLTCAFCKKECVEGDTRKECQKDEKECVDLEKDCEYWRQQGFCSSGSTYYNYMKENCPLECGFCSEAADCTFNADTDASCSWWKTQGYCSSSQYLDFMRENCGTTCRLCRKEIDADTVGETCPADVAGIPCSTYVQQGHCQGTYAEYMRQNCATSCGVYCAGSCQDKSAYCGSWSAQGYCYSNPYYMTENCAASCGKCYQNSKSTSSGYSNKGCQDYNTYCSSWASQGYCRSNPGYMNVNCARSCGLNCQSATTSSSCRDTDTRGYCSSWANSGQCQINPSYMHVHCKKSCGKCSLADSSKSSTGCQDYHNSCAYWASTGYCTYNQAYMHQNCKKSCNLNCGGQTQSSSNAKCNDLNTYCSYWAGQGYCTYNQAYMRVNCKRSCNLCGVQASSCLDNDYYCASWASQGYCYTNPGYMHVSCKQSCNVC